MKNSINIKTVAQKADVSVGSVSNYLHGKAVKTATRERIAAAVRELGFIPNPNAQAIHAQRSRTIVIFIVQSIRSSALWLETYLLAIIETAGNAGLRCIIEYVDDNHAYPVEKLFRRADGVVLIGHFSAEFFREFSAVPDLPVISDWDAPEYPAATVIPYDFRMTLREAITVLRRAGHEKIGFISDNAGVGAEKINDWLRVSGEMIPGAQCAWIETIDHFSECRQGFIATQKLLARCPELTAIIFSADIVAMAGLSALAAVGKKIPADISVVTLDNSFWAHAMFPAVTAVGPDYPALARQIIAIINHRCGQTATPSSAEPRPTPFSYFPGATVRDLRNS